MKYSNLSKKPMLFSRYTGLSISEFNKLTKELEPLWQKAEAERLSRSNRQRIIGGGRKYKLATFEDKLLLVLFFYKLYLTFDLLGSFFQDLDKSCVSRLIAKLEPTLQKKMNLSKIKRERRKPISTLNELLILYPEIIEFIGDATEQEIPRPKDKRKRKEYYSGKKKRHTIKTQILIERNKGQILEVSQSVPGSIHDYKLFKESDLGERLPPDIPSYWDKGYQGFQKDYPNLKVFLPKKANRWHKLNETERTNNQNLNKVRVKVEHAILKCKRFKILSQIYRHSLKDYQKRFKVVASLINFKIQENIKPAQQISLLSRIKQPDFAMV